MTTSRPHRMISDLDFTKTQLAVFVVILLLAVDTINPVKIFIHVFPAVQPWHIASVSIALIAYVFISEFKELLYFAVKVFFHSIISIFFRSVEVVGRDNIPRYGPVIFVGNHANQFVDAVMILSTCEHKISYLMAEASYQRRVIGDVAWALGVVPVKRAIDYSIKGTGKIVMERSDNLVKVTGSDTTMFLKELKVGDKIRPPGTSIAMKVISIESDSVLQLDGSEADSVKLPREPTSYDILPKIDQRDVYGKVIDRLAGGGAVGIFPEGGSHDQTDLLPLKVGVALIAYEAILQDGLNVPIVPVGLNYFQRHKFRGRAVVEYGRPIIIDPSTVKSYKQGGEEKRRVCNELLERIQDGMKSVLVTAPDYETLQLIHTARRLWQRKELKTSEKQDLSRRFAEGYQQLILHVNGEPPKEWLELNDRVVKYQKELTELGIRDYQVPGLDREKGEITSVEDLDGDTVLREMRLPYQIAHVLILLLLAGIPAIFLNLPVGLIARIYAEGRRKKAVARSKVKIRGHDVLMTEKILVSIVLVPTFWVLYALLLYRYTELDGPAITLGFFCMPLFSYMSIMWAEAGMVDLKDLRPYLMRLLPANRRRIIALPETRKNLQRDIRAFVKIHGPLLGDLYYNEDVDWSEYQEKKRKSYPLLSDALTPTRKKEEGKTE